MYHICMAHEMHYCSTCAFAQVKLEQIMHQWHPCQLLMIELIILSLVVFQREMRESIVLKKQMQAN